MSESSCIYFKTEKCLSALETLTRYLNTHPNCSPYSTNELLSLGAVYVNSQRILNFDHIIQPNDLIRFYPDPKRYPLNEFLKPEIIFQHKDFTVIDKPAPLPMHATSSNTKENLISLLEKSFDQKFLITSRLDADTKGLVIFAHSESGQQKINQLFQKRRITKIYKAQSYNQPPLGKHLHYQSPLKTPVREFQVHQQSLGWKSCEMVVHQTHQTHLGCSSKIELITGRTHQIRGQMALLGCPLIGDALYGDKNEASPLMLDCVQLNFIWNGESINIEKTL